MDNTIEHIYYTDTNIIIYSMILQYYVTTSNTHFTTRICIIISQLLNRFDKFLTDINILFKYFYYY
jgi:hypothetical protein